MKRMFVTAVVAAMALVSIGCNCCAKKSCSTCGSTTYGDEFLGPAPEWQSAPPAAPNSTFAPQ